MDDSHQARLEDPELRAREERIREQQAKLDQARKKAAAEEEMYRREEARLGAAREQERLRRELAEVRLRESGLQGLTTCSVAEEQVVSRTYSLAAHNLFVYTGGGADAAAAGGLRGETKEARGRASPPRGGGGAKTAGAGSARGAARRGAPPR